MNRDFNEVVCVDHFFLNDICLFHAMDSVTRYSACCSVPDTSLASAVYAFEACWLSQFWPPAAVLGDDAFNHRVFTDHLASLDIDFRPVPPRRHNKNVLESRHGVIRSMFLRLLNDDGNNASLSAIRSVRISNDLFGSDILSAFEMAKGFSKPVVPGIEPKEFTQELVHAQQLDVKRKLIRILRSKAIQEAPIGVGDLVEVHIRNAKSKRGKWLSPRSILKIDRADGIVTVTGSGGRTLSAAFEDVRPALPDDALSSMIQEGTDVADREINNLVDLELIDADGTAQTEVTVPKQDEEDCNDPLLFPCVGERVEVLWPLMNTYYGGIVSTVSDGLHMIDYDDGDTETLDMCKDSWHYGNPKDAIEAALAVSCELGSSEQCDLQSMFEYFCNRPFFAHRAQAFPSYLISNAYATEEDSFKKTVTITARADVPANANVISSHTIYKIKVDDNAQLKLKARIAPHGNEDSLKYEMRSDCLMCAPCGVRILISVASLHKWRVTKADVKSAFLQTEQAERHVYVLPPKESRDRHRFLWLLQAAAYGLVNANAKFPVQSDRVLMELGLSRVTDMPQMFYLKQDGVLVMVLAKTVDDLLVTGVPHVVDHVLQKFNETFHFGTVMHGPGQMRYFGFNIVQNEDFTVEIDADDKLNKLESNPITHSRRKDVATVLNEVEKSAFSSLNSSLGWLGTTVSPFCAAVASRLQQCLPDVRVSDIMKQGSLLRELQKLGTTIKFCRPTDKGQHQVSILVFSDAGRPNDSTQISVISGLLIGQVQEGSIYHTVSRASHKCGRPVRSIAAGEILAAGEAIDEALVLKRAYAMSLDIAVELIVALDSRDLFSSLSTQRKSVDRSVRADVNCIRYSFETRHANRIVWFPGRLNLADPGTKPDSPLTPALQLLLFSGKIPHDFPELEASCAAEKPLG